MTGAGSPLGSLFTEPKDRKIPEASDRRYVGMEHIAPETTRIVRWAEPTTATSTSKVFRKNDVLFGRLRPYLKKVALADFDGVCSGEILVLRPNKSVLPGFLYLLAANGTTVKHAVDVSAGSRMPRVASKDLSALDVTLPPRPVQERFVEVIGAVDDQIAALDSEASTARRLLNMVLAEHFATVEGERHRIVDLCSHVVGGVWGKPESEDEVDRLALGPRIYTPGTSEFVTNGSPVRSFTTKQADTRTVREHDIILERSGGSPEQPVGRVVIAGPGLEPCVPTDFQRLMRVDPEKALPRYVFWRLRHDWASGLTRNYSRRTTGITNLSVKDYIAREVSVPSMAEQAGLIESAEAVDALVVTSRAEAASLRRVRAGLLSGLLDRTINIESAELEV